MRQTGQFLQLQRTGEPLNGKKVAILGKAPSSLALAPYGDTTWEIWTINNAAQMGAVPRWDRQFELHPIEWTKKAEYNGYYEWLCLKHGKPIYVREPTPEIPDAVVYPHKEVIAAFGTKYFTNSISWMVALAICEGYSEIGLWGVDMAQHHVGLEKSEYASQRPSCEFFIGCAVGFGIKVHIPPTSDLLKCAYLYGIDFEQADAMQLKWEAREREVTQRIAIAEQAKEKAQFEEWYLRGAVDDMQYWKQWIQKNAA